MTQLAPRGPAHDDAPALAVLDYDALLADYRTNLLDRLRGFGPAEAWLALWVPDDDPVASLRNLWDAAAAAGCGAVQLDIGAATLAGIDRGVLLDMAARFGSACLHDDAQRCSILVQGLHPAVGLPAVAPSRPRPPVRERAAAPAPARATVSPYAAAIAEAARDPFHGHLLPPHPGCVLVAAGHDGVMLTLAIEHDTHRVREAGFFGSTDAVTTGVLEVLCRVIESLPVLEAAQHGPARLEAALRDRSAPPPVPGIVTPRAADPAFALPTLLVRQALQRYREHTGFAERDSRYDAGPGPRWRALDENARAQAVTATLARYARAHGAEASDAELVAIEIDIRIVARLGGTLAGPERAAHCMALERALQAEIDPRLELYLEERKDRNKLRRLAVV
ncbi:MAG: hypothetical protein K1X88_18680 [Nannocystaceae bacterium]|nr:hypothetical protein [Nannocystaceae bacterium]